MRSSGSLCARCLSRLPGGVTRVSIGTRQSPQAAPSAAALRAACGIGGTTLMAGSLLLKRRGVAVMAAALGLSMTLAACGGGDDDDDASAGGGSTGSAEEGTELDCAQFEEFGDLDGTTVTLYTSIVAPEDTAYINSFKPFEDCTGVDVQYEGSKEFE